MGISISGITPVAAVVPGGGSAAPRTPGTAGGVDFGPAVVFTAAEFDQAASIQMYNRAGQSIALTQWLRSGTLPAPQPATGTGE